MNKKICCILCLIILFSCASCGSTEDNLYKTLEDEVVARSLLLQQTYGKIGFDAAYAYCDGEETYLIIYFYGIGKESQNLGDTYCMYITNKDEDVRISDPNGNYDDLSVQLMNVVCLTYEAKWQEYKNNDMEITYEQYKNFEEGYLPLCYGSKDIDNKLR